MADIVGSRSKKGQALMHEFKYLAEKINIEEKKAFLSPITITLGDEFQSVVKSLEDGIRVIINIEEYILKQKYEFKLRYILYYGAIETEINKSVAHEMLGEGLIKARELLGKNKKEKNRIYVELQNKKSNILNKLFYLYTSISDKWKIRDYGLIYLLIKNKDYYEVSKQLNKDRGYIWRKNKNLEIQKYNTIKELINEILEL